MMTPLTRHRWMLCFFLCYTLLTGWLLWHHEPWRDEAQAWLIARDLSPMGIIRQMSYEGTPALWHFMLLPLAKLGLPYESMAILHWILALTALSLFLFRAPLDLSTKLLFTFGYFALFEYSVVARSYVLTMLLLFVLAAMDEKRFDRPILYGCLVALLSQSNVLGFLIALPLVISFCFENRFRLRSKKILCSISLMLLSMAFTIFQVIPAADNYLSGSRGKPYSSINAIAGAFFPQWSTILPLGVVAFLIGIITTFFVLSSLKQNRRILFFAIISISCLLALFTFKYAGGARHYGLIIIVLLAALWMNHRARPLSGSLKAVVNVSLSLSVISAILCTYLETRFSFSAARDAAYFLSNQDLHEELIIASPMPHASALLPYLPNTSFWYLDAGEYGTFSRWNHTPLKPEDVSSTDKKTLDHTISKILREERRETALLLLSAPLPEVYENEYRLIYQTDIDRLHPLFWKGYPQEKFYLYHVLAKASVSEK